MTALQIMWEILPRALLWGIIISVIFVSVYLTALYFSEKESDNA